MNVDFEIELYGQRHIGSYAVHNDMLTVWNRGMGSRSIRLAGLNVPQTARRLLMELVVASRPPTVPGPLNPQAGEAWS